MIKPNDKAKEAYSRFDTSEHGLLNLLRAILHTAAGGLDPDDAHQAADDGAFEVIYGLADLAEKLMKRDLHPAVVDLRDAIEPQARDTCALRCVRTTQDSSSDRTACHG